MTIVDTADVISALERTRTRLTARSGWTQGAGARNKWGFSRSIDDADVAAVCAYGALLLVAADDEITRAAMTALADMAGMSVAQFNDTHSHEEVLSWIDHTIAHLRAQRSLVLMLNSVSVAPAPCKELA